MSDLILYQYYGNLEPQAMNTELSGKLKSKLNELVRLEEKLESQLSPEAKKTFSEYRDHYNEVMCLSCADAFVSGAKIGAKLTCEMLS